ncbi:MAG: hypothetical protein N0C90_20355 [Candidatus Thiodiazotropha endolucinida]|nr:hypothetical protein [Candidatus Thiodiazotropha taylori]MCW4263706.1 hypothetical protein [Candidatus Thiodiazotropha endolucinida]
MKRLSSSLRKKSKEETVKRRVQEDRQKVPSEARTFFFNSKWVESVKKRLKTAVPSTTHSRDLVEYRNFLITAITLWNGQRPMPIRLMSLDDVLCANESIADGSENEEDRTYMVMSVAGHKTAKTWGEAHFSIPPWLYHLLLRYTQHIRLKYGFEEEKCVFRTESGTRLEQSSTVNQAIQAAWRASGTSNAFPGSLTCTSNRKLITTVVRNKDPSLAPLIASQLTHSVQTADRIYATERSKQLSSAAVHAAKRAMEEGRVEMNVRQEEEKVEEKEDEKSVEHETEVGNTLVIDFENIQEGTKREDFVEDLFIQLNILPFEIIERDANYWALQAGLGELSRLTSIIEIVASFRTRAQQLFNIDIFNEIQSLGAMPISQDPAVGLAVTIFSLAGIAEAFGADRRPYDPPTNRPLSKTEIFRWGNIEAGHTYEKEENSGHEESTPEPKRRRITARFAVPETLPSSKSSDEDVDVGISGAICYLKKRCRFSENFNEDMMQIFKDDLEESIENASHIRLSVIRSHMADIHRVYPEVTAQQVRDKLFNIMKAERRTRGLTPVKTPKKEQ